MKNKIRLNEKKIKEIISKTIKKVLSESEGMVFDIDISEIDISALKKIYRDFRLTPNSKHFGDILSSPSVIKEAFGDILSPDETVLKLKNKYGIPEECVIKKEAYNKIYVYVVTALIGINDQLIEEDMSKMGYFCGFRGNVNEVNGMKFQVLQFEPLCQMQDDITDEIINNNDFLYHWTPEYCVKDIMENGLVPGHRNKVFNYTPRTYLIQGGYNKRYFGALGQSLCFNNNDERNDGNYALLSIDVSKINDNIRFYYDPNSEMGVYTEQVIPPDIIKVLGNAQFMANMK